DMIVERYTDDLPRLDQLLCDGDVFSARRWVAARVVVKADDRRRILDDRNAEDFAWMHDRTVEVALGDQLPTHYLACGVEHEHMELFLLHAAQLRDVEVGDILGALNLLSRNEPVGLDATRKLERRSQRHSFRWSDAVYLLEFFVVAR